MFESCRLKAKREGRPTQFEMRLRLREQALLKEIEEARSQGKIAEKTERPKNSNCLIAFLTCIGESFRTFIRAPAKGN
jgi:hypothetical protein